MSLFLSVFNSAPLDAPTSPVADEPTPGCVVSPPLVLSLELVPAEPWLAPLDEPMELLPELEPARLVPDELDELGVWTVELELPELDEPAEPDEPAF